jgi:HK97 family phage major capsid protein
MVNTSYYGDYGIGGTGGALIPNQLMFPGLMQQIVETALPAQVLEQLFIKYPTNGRQAVVIPVERGSKTAVASRVGEGDEFDLDIAPLSSSTITVYKVGRGTPITNEMIMYQQIPVIEQRIRRQGLVMGNTRDYDCSQVMLAAITPTNEAGGLGLSTRTACTGKSVGFDLTVGTIAGIGQKDIIDARARMLSNNLFADTLVVNPTGFASLSLLPMYHAQCLYGKPVYQSGELGEIEGLRILVSNNVTSGTAYLINTGKTGSPLGQYVPMGFFCESLGITSMIREEPRRDGIEIYSKTMYCPAVTSGANIEGLTYTYS